MKHFSYFSPDRTKNGFLLILLLLAFTFRANAQTSPSRFPNTKETKDDEGQDSGNYGVRSALKYGRTTATEGELVLYWTDRMYWNDRDDAWNRLGIWNTSVKLYYLGSNDANNLRSPFGRDLNIGENNANVLELGQDKWSGSYSIGDIGPYRDWIINSRHAGGSGEGGDSRHRMYNNHIEQGSVIGHMTSKLKAPTDVTIKTIDVNGIPYPSSLTWKKGSNYNNSLIAYKIQRKVGTGNFADLAIVSGDTFSYTLDAESPASGDYVYSVQTILSENAPEDWNHEPAASEPGAQSPVFNVTLKDLNVSTTENSKVRLSWPSLNNVRGIDKIIIYRRYGTTTEELTNVGKSIRTYTDFDVIPGMYYTYYLKLLGDGTENVQNVNSWKSVESKGRSLPNGKISGYVTSGNGVGISGTTITVTPINFLFNGIEQKKEVRTTLTGDDGYYEIDTLFYDKKAEFIVVPKLDNYVNRHSPNQLKRMLTESEYNIKAVNFTDTASFTVKGMVYFPLKKTNGTNILVEADSVDIYVDGAKKTTTDATGKYALSFPVVGTHHIAAYYKGHLIKPANDALNTTTFTYSALTSGIVTRKTIDDRLILDGRNIAITRDYTNVNFVDLQTDTLHVNVYATDGKFAIGEEVLVEVQPKSPTGTVINGTFDILSVFSNGNKTSTVPSRQINTINNSYNWGSYLARFNTTAGSASILLPATRYQVKVNSVLLKANRLNPFNAGNTTSNTNIDNTINKITKTINLGARDSITFSKTVITKCSPARDTTEIIKGKNGADSTIYIAACSRIKETTEIKTTALKPIPALNFVYHKDVEINWIEEADMEKYNLLAPNQNRLAASDISKWLPIQRQSNALYLMTQGDRNVLNFQIKEKYQMYTGGPIAEYVVDSARIEVYDQISDSLQRQIFNYKADPAKASKYFKYTLNPGMPNFSSLPFYDKALQIYAIFGEGISELKVSKLIYGMVTGEREEEGKGVIVTPQIPFMVLHRPPGDNSYAKLSKGSKFTWGQTTRYGTSGGAGTILNANIGVVVSDFQKSFQIDTRLLVGRDNNGQRGFEKSLTITEEIATSDNENNIGKKGDVIFFNSNALNYSVMSQLRYYPPANGKPGEVTSLKGQGFSDQGVSTSVMYTYAHIKDTEIPKLNKMIENNRIRIEKEPLMAPKYRIETGNLQSQVNVYKKVLREIDSVQNLTVTNRDKLKPYYQTMVQEVLAGQIDSSDADKKVKQNLQNSKGDLYAMQKNITFSNGVDYTFNVENSMTAIDNFEYEVYLDLDIDAYGHIGGESAGFGEFGAFSKLHTILDSKAIERSGEKNSSIEIHLADKNPGDYFSVDVLVDPKYKTPLFAVYGGASSCPYEEGTLQRDKPVISIMGAQKQFNVPANQAASFTVQIGNESVTEEGRQYNVRVNPRSNPYGAKIFLGGQQINGNVATFYVAPKDSARITLEVWRGPLAYQYKDIELIIGSTCENLETDNSDDLGSSLSSTKVSVDFTPACGTVDLFKPGKNWLISSLNNNRIQLTFNKYDANNPNLINIAAEYRKVSGQNAGTVAEQWKQIVSVAPADLKDAFYDFTMDVSSLPDGKYEFRAKSVCKDGYFYSDVYEGTIDRTNLNVYGLPEPQDGILGVGKSLSVSFNSTLAADQPKLKIKLIRQDTHEEIPNKFTMNANFSSISIVPEGGDAIFDALENIEIKAELTGAISNNANEQKDPIIWSFIVNRSSVYWSPRNVIVNAIENQQSSLKAKLINKTAKEQGFTITKYPAWLTPLLKSSKIVPFGELNLDFTINKNLNTGVYTDTVVAEVEGKKQNLYITVNVLRTPPNWTVNPANFKYNMSFTAQFSVNQTDLLTSKDVRDKMGVFAGDQCRGVAQIEYDSQRDKYVAYLTVYSNTPANEELNIHFWDAYPGIEYQGKERLPFVANGNVGNLVNPFIVHPEGVYQTIPLSKGWTWISLNVQQKDMSINKVLKSLKPTAGDLIKTLSNNNTYSQYSKTMGWVGKLDSVNLYNSYMIYVAKADTLRVLGNFLDLAANVKMGKGWSWAGYPMALNMEVPTYFKNFNPVDGLRVISQEEFTQYNATTKTWSGSLKYLRPGKGYKMYSATDGFSIPAIPYDPITGGDPSGPTLPPLNNPAALTVINNTSNTVNSTTNNTSVNTSNFENNMSVTTVINQGGQVVNNITNRYETFVYIDNKLVNIVNQTVLPDGKVVGFIPVNGDKTDEGKSVVIKVHDKEEKKDYTAKIENPIKQETDDIAGTIEQPIVLVLEGLSDVMVSNLVEKQKVSKAEPFNYTLKLKNTGPDLAVNLVLTDTLSKAFDYVSSTPEVVFDPVSRTFKLAILQFPSGAEKDFIISLKANTVGNQFLGNGLLKLNNDKDLSNNTVLPLAITVVDSRANDTKLLIPSLFTPNGDGINDRFEIVGLNEFYTYNKLVIYNKNYNQVYVKENYKNDWSGDNLPTGSYGYILTVKDTQGKQIIYRGYITIVYQ